MRKNDAGPIMVKLCAGIVEPRVKGSKISIKDPKRHMLCTDAEEAKCAGSNENKVSPKQLMPKTKKLKPM